MLLDRASFPTSIFSFSRDFHNSCGRLFPCVLPQPSWASCATMYLQFDLPGLLRRLQPGFPHTCFLQQWEGVRCVFINRKRPKGEGTVTITTLSPATSRPEGAEISVCHSCRANSRARAVVNGGRAVCLRSACISLSGTKAT